MNTSTKDSTKNALKKYLLAALFGSIGGAVTVLTIFLLDEGLNLIWSDIFGMETETPTRNAGVFITMAIATIIVGFIIHKYGRAHGALEQILEEVETNGRVQWRTLPKALLVAFPSLLSGASLGPEAPAAIASVGTAGFLSEKSHFDIDTTRHANTATFSGMLGAILSSPFLAPTMIAESAKTKAESLKPLLTTSLIASAFGMATFYFLFGRLSTFAIPNSTYTGSGYYELFAAFIFGISGCAIIAITAKIIEKAGTLLDKLAPTEITRLILTALIVSILMFAVPITMFSGQHTLDDLYMVSLSTGIIGLIVIGIVKIASTSLLLRAGFIGGAIFPAIFAGAAFGLALNQILNVSPMVAVGATSVGLLAVMMRQPVSAAILTLLIYGFSASAPVACGLAGALLVLSILPKKQ